jgi:hypothetical protein
MIDDDDASQLFAMRDELRKAERDFKVKDDIAKVAKKRMETKQKEFNEYVDDLANPTHKLPFKDGDSSSVPILEGDGPMHADAVPVEPDPDAEDYRVVEDDERWRLVSMEDLIVHGLSASDIKKLQAAKPPITNLGELADFTADGKHRLVDIPGIGEATSNRITDAYIGWYQANPRTIAKQKPVLETSENPAQDALKDGDGLDVDPGHESPAESILDDSRGVPVESGDGDSLEDDHLELTDDGSWEDVDDSNLEAD